MARWGLGVATHPSFITGYGSKLFFDDDQEFPDTYSITYEYPGSGKIGEKKLLIYEQRIWSPYRHDAEGMAHPPNELHLAFRTDASGAGTMTAENVTTASDQAVAIVVHITGFVEGG